MIEHRGNIPGAGDVEQNRKRDPRKEERMFRNQCVEVGIGHHRGIPTVNAKGEMQSHKVT